MLGSQLKPHNWVAVFSSSIYPENTSEENPKKFNFGPEQEARTQRLWLVEDMGYDCLILDKKWGCLLVSQLGCFLHIKGNVMRIASLFIFHD